MLNGKCNARFSHKMAYQLREWTIFGYCPSPLKVDKKEKKGKITLF